MAYSELIKNFEKVRAYMRQFYVYGFKCRSEYDVKSTRSYDDERRRIESWLGEYMSFTQTSDGKNVFISVDSRLTKRNPFYKAWKAKSFTDKDITLHFILFDLLPSPDVSLTLGEIMDGLDSYLSAFDEPMSFDESTVRKKLKEYVSEGIIVTEKDCRRVTYRRASDTDIFSLSDAVDFFSEASPCGVVGSFISDKLGGKEGIFSFKHHYITGALDSDIMAQLFDAISKKSYITVDNLGKHADKARTLRLVPLKIFISAQNGRQNLIAYHEKANRLNSYRLDYLTNVRIEEECRRFDKLRDALALSEENTWGVNCRWSMKNLEHVEFEIKVNDDEEYIVKRLEREKRCGEIEDLGDGLYRFSADVYDSREMLPWIRTFISRIKKMNFSNRTVENIFKRDLEQMYQMYSDEGGDVSDIQ